MPIDRLPEPWLSFLGELDRRTSSRMELQCIGGFALTVAYGAPRTTADLDVLWAVHQPSPDDVLESAVRGGELHRRFGVFIDRVTVVTAPCDYISRLIPICPDAFQHLALSTLDPCDLALCKLERNSQRDREDVKWLARQPGFDAALLRRRYHEELREFLIGPVEGHDLTLDLWIEMLEEGQSVKKRPVDM